MLAVECLNVNSWLSEIFSTNFFHFVFNVYSNSLSAVLLFIGTRIAAICIAKESPNASNCSKADWITLKRSMSLIVVSKNAHNRYLLPNTSREIEWSRKFWRNLKMIFQFLQCWDLSIPQPFWGTIPNPSKTTPTSLYRSGYSYLISKSYPCVSTENVRLVFDHSNFSPGLFQAATSKNAIVLTIILVT